MARSCSSMQVFCRRSSSIPVIDVRGQILVGFSPQSVDRALAKAKSGTVL